MDTAKIEDRISPLRCPSLPVEVWNMIGEHIQDQATILSLITTCRSFRDVFVPSLHHRFLLQLNKIPTSKLRRKFLPTGLRHTRKLEVFLDEFLGRFADGRIGSTYKVKHNDLYASFVIRILEDMPNLRSFRWVDFSCEESYQPSLILQNPEILRMLKSTASLQDVSIVFADEEIMDYTAACRCWIPLHGFKNLASLELYNFYGNFPSLIEDLVNVLADCPELKVLGLGMQRNVEFETTPNHLLVNQNTDFIERLCLDYGSRDGTSPLPLDTLRLGRGVSLDNFPFKSERAYLTKLVKLDGLRCVHVYNGSAQYEEDDFIYDTGWGQLKDCKWLQQLSVTRFTETIREWLNDDGKTIKELIITDPYSPYDEGLENFDLLENTRFSMLFVPTKAPTLSDFDDWAERLYDPYETARRDAPVITVLDRLHDKGAQLTRLGLCLDLGRQWQHFSSFLPNLGHLRQLRIDHIHGQLGQFPRKSSSLWADLRSSEDIAYQYARLIQSKCPSLEYVQIGQYAWQVIHGDFELTSSGGYNPTARLRPLGGLHGPAPPAEYITDADFNEAERYCRKEDKREREMEDRIRNFGNAL